MLQYLCMNGSIAQSSTLLSSLVSRVFLWMGGALAVTAVVSLIVTASPSLSNLLISSPFIYIGLLIAEVALVMYLSFRIRTMSPTTAFAAFFAYAILNGITLSTIFLIYTASSIATAFFVTAGTFGCMAIIGYTTKKDLTGFGSIALMVLIGIILASIVNIFLNNPVIYWITSILGVIIFAGLTAYDAQKIKQFAISGNGDSDTIGRAEVMGALTLYLDFINLFLFILRFAGRRK